MRRLGIAGIIAALFVLGTAGPTLAIDVETPDDGPDAPEPAAPDPGAEQEPPSEVCQAIEEVQREAGNNGAPPEFVNGLEKLQGELGCPGAQPPPGDDDDEDPLAALKAELCPVLDDVIAEAEANDAPAEFLGALDAVRNDVLECPTTEPPPTGDDDDADNGDDDDAGESGDDDTNSTPDSEVAAGGVGNTDTGTGGAELPRTGAPSLMAPLGFGAAGLGAALRKLFLR